MPVVCFYPRPMYFILVICIFPHRVCVFMPVVSILFPSSAFIFICFHARRIFYACPLVCLLFFMFVPSFYSRNRSLCPSTLLLPVVCFYACRQVFFDRYLGFYALLMFFCPLYMFLCPSIFLRPSSVIYTSRLSLCPLSVFSLVCIFCPSSFFSPVVCVFVLVYRLLFVCVFMSVVYFYACLLSFCQQSVCLCPYSLFFSVSFYGRRQVFFGR